MDMRLLFLLLSCLTFNECTGTQWSSGPENNAVIYTCMHDYLSLPWTLLLSPGDVIENIQWSFSGRSDELIATEAHSHFFVLPAFSGRVSKSTNAGIDVDHMQDLDTGNYSVQVLIRQVSDGIVTLHRTAYVQVSDDLQIVNRQLLVVKLPLAEYSNQTGQYHVVLSCGNFIYPTKPPFMATWLTPSGRSLDSDKYENNQFFLLLPNPVEGGSYICRVSAPSACLHGNNSKEGTVIVDKMEARLAVLEAQQMALGSHNSMLQAKVVALENDLSLLKASPGNFQKPVSFHAVLEYAQYDLPWSAKLVFDKVVTNIGNGYNPNSGVFTAPYNGTYFFLASSDENSTDRGIYIALKANDTQLHVLETEDSLVHQSGSVHGVIFLTAGQTAWVEVLYAQNQFIGSDFSAFSGFLICPVAP